MIHNKKNYAFRDPECDNGDVFEYCNLTQLVPNTVLCEGTTALVFRNCNLCNCLLPSDAKVEHCNTTQVSRCSHLHLEWIARGLTECVEDCVHVTEVETVEVGGVVIDTIYTREDAVQ